MLFCGGVDQPTINPTTPCSMAMQQHGLNVVYKEYPGVTHEHAPTAAIGDALDFFAAHPGK